MDKKPCKIIKFMKMNNIRLQDIIDFLMSIQRMLQKIINIIQGCHVNKLNCWRML